jgi:hypothetical protein
MEVEIIRIIKGIPDKKLQKFLSLLQMYYL